MPAVLDLSGYVIQNGGGVDIHWEDYLVTPPDGQSPYHVYTQYLTFKGSTDSIGYISPYGASGYFNIIGTQGSDSIDNDFQGPVGPVIGGPGSAIYGLGGDDVIVGAALLDGGDGNDRLTLSFAATALGGAGDDVLSGSSAADHLSGGTGSDTADYAGAVAGMTVSLATGLASDGDVLDGIENLRGSAFADALTGNGSANALQGGNGNDVLAGGAGADGLNGEAGIDRADYLGSAAGVTVNLATNANSGGDAAGDVLSGIEALGGSNLLDTLTGTDGANTVWGRDGDDLLRGGGGNDSLYGEAGADDLDGGFGDDVLIGGTGADHLAGGAGLDTAHYAQAGAAVTVSLAAGITNGAAGGDTLLSIENVVGSAFDDLLQGDAGANALSGLAGADRLYGGGGNDALSGGDGNDALIGGAGADVLSGGNGIDVVQYDAAATAVTVNLATGTGIGGEAAGDTYSGVENVLGSAQNDTITGNAGANTLWGMAGNDVLIAGGGADSLKGGSNVDVFVYKAAADSTAAARDAINDFSHESGDRIDLGAIDADGNAGNGNSAFTFLGGGAFTGAGHELRVTVSGGVQTVLADLNGDKAADMAITVISATTLVAGDFVL